MRCLAWSMTLMWSWWILGYLFLLHKPLLLAFLLSFSGNSAYFSWNAIFHDHLWVQLGFSFRNVDLRRRSKTQSYCQTALLFMKPDGEWYCLRHFLMNIFASKSFHRSIIFHRIEAHRSFHYLSSLFCKTLWSFGLFNINLGVVAIHDE